MDRSSSSYSLKRAQDLLGLSRTVIEGLVRAGFVSPERGRRNELRFSFQDLMLLRTARALRQAKVPPRRIMRSLSRLKESLPSELPMSGLRITAAGSEVAVHDRSGPWEPASGQMLLDFEVAPTNGDVAFFSKQAAPEALASPRTLLEQGEALESSDPQGAEDAYRAALALAPDYLDALLNLGALLCDQHRCHEAVELYDGAVERLPDLAALHFNHAIALEDQQRLAQALAAYERCLALEPDLADAHFNTARLHEQLGNAQAALRHFNAYRKLQQVSAE